MPAAPILNSFSILSTPMVFDHNNSYTEVLVNMLDNRSVARSEGQYVDDVPLQSPDHGKLLDIIDQLRTHGVERCIPLPQLVVCGDQTSGKSSVLEAISNVRFPANEGVCTRFATEVMLRRANEESSKVTIAAGIVASEARSAEELERISDFSGSATFDQVASVIEDAKTAMGLVPQAKTITDDVLKVEICGPRQPHLTLVDLPGVYHAGPGSEIAKEMVLKYMENKRSIILAIISARSDRELQIVTEMIKDVDPTGDRTFGIITKPDEIKVGMEQDWLDLAQNKVVTYRHGWHILKNRDHKDRNQTAKERDDSEAFFFSKDVWKTLTSDIMGINTLRPRLSTVLKDHIMQELPSLMEDVDKEIVKCKATLSTLGQPRETLKEQQTHLLQTSSQFSHLAQAAVDGNYSHPFFGSAFSADALEKRLRACVQNILENFKIDMYRKGHRFEITNTVTKEKRSRTEPQKISESDFLKKVETLLENSRGRELSGCYNPLIISDLFFEQAQPWKKIANDCCRSLLNASRDCVALILSEVTDDSTRRGLMEKVIDLKMTELSEELNEKVAQILLPHRQGHAITYIDRYDLDHGLSYMKQSLEKALREYFKPGSDEYVSETEFSMTDLLRKLKLDDQNSLQKFTCMEIVDHMKAYYEIAMKRFIDSFASQGFENTILRKLPDMLSPSIIINLDDDLIKYIAGEHESNKETRAQVSMNLESLKRGQGALDSLGYGNYARAIPIAEGSSFDELLSSSDISDGEDSSLIINDSPQDTPQDSEKSVELVESARAKKARMLSKKKKSLSKRTVHDDEQSQGEIKFPPVTPFQNLEGSFGIPKFGYWGSQRNT